MIYDYYASEAAQVAGSVEEIVKADDKDALKEEAEKKREEILKFGDPHLIYHCLSLKDRPKNGSRSGNSAGNLRATWARMGPREEERRAEWPGRERFKTPVCDLTLLPRYSFFLQFSFTLARPYISRGEQEFYIVDNPILRDTILDLPYVAASSWKGSLRVALWQMGRGGEDEAIRRIFGNERGEQAEFRRGRLHFYPTFFSKTSAEIINPHDRERRIGEKPIYFEAVPQDEEGLFSLLYVPYDGVGGDPVENGQLVATDLMLIAGGLREMLTVHGFGARTSSGYGCVRPESCKGNISVRAEDMGGQERPLPVRPEEQFQKYLSTDGTPKEEFRGDGEGGLLTNAEYKERGERLGGGSLGEFRKFRQWHLEHGWGWQAHCAGGGAEAGCPTWEFTGLGDLVAKAGEIASQLHREGGE